MSASRSPAGARANDDPAAWERMVALYAPLILHWCRQAGLRGEDAADASPEVFQAVAVHLGRFRRERPGDTFRGWLRAITRNKVNGHFRRREREPTAAGGSEARALLSQLPGLSPPDTNPDGGPPDHALLRRASEAVRPEFEPRTWEAFRLTAVEGRPAGGVAAELGMSAGAVRVAESRVLHRLRIELGDPPGC